MTGRKGIGPGDRVAPAEHVRCRNFDGDLVMVDLHGGEYFALDAVGARMWALLTSGQTPVNVAQSLATEYEAHEDEILRDCIKLVNDLLQRGLLVRVP